MGKNSGTQTKIEFQPVPAERKKTFADGSVQAGSRGQLGNRPKGLLLGLFVLTSARRSFHYWPIYFCWLLFWKIKSFHRDEFERTGSTAKRLLVDILMTFNF